MRDCNIQYPRFGHFVNVIAAASSPVWVWMCADVHACTAERAGRWLGWLYLKRLWHFEVSRGANELKCPWNEQHPARLAASTAFTRLRVCFRRGSVYERPLSLWMTPSLQADILSTLRTISLMKALRLVLSVTGIAAAETKPAAVFGVLAPWQRPSSQSYTNTSDAPGSSDGRPNHTHSRRLYRVCVNAYIPGPVTLTQER